jgi:hypothetical protein
MNENKNKGKNWFQRKVSQINDLPQYQAIPIQACLGLVFVILVIIFSPILLPGVVGLGIWNIMSEDC